MSPWPRLETARGGILAENHAAISKPEPRNGRERLLLLVGLNQLAKGHVAFAANDGVNAKGGIGPFIWRQARIVAADDDPDIGFTAIE